jgi:hypothetical protein
MSAPMACCIDILSSGCVHVSEMEKLRTMARAYRQHRLLTRKRARKEGALFGDLRKLVQGHKLEAPAVLRTVNEGMLLAGTTRTVRRLWFQP